MYVTPHVVSGLDPRPCTKIILRQRVSTCHVAAVELERTPLLEPSYWGQKSQLLRAQICSEVPRLCSDEMEFVLLVDHIAPTKEHKDKQEGQWYHSYGIGETFWCCLFASPDFEVRHVGSVKVRTHILGCFQVLSEVVVDKASQKDDTAIRTRPGKLFH